MPPMSKRKRGGGKSGPKTKKGRKFVSKELVHDSGSDDDDADKDGGDDGGADSEWVVEEVVGKRTLASGKVEYFLKWKNWPPSTNTWEPVEHLNCPELVEAYEAKLAQKADMDDRPNGFDDGLTTRAVRGIAKLEKNGKKELHYLVEWEDTDRIEPILATIVREKVPQEVIKFLSSKITWTNKRTHTPNKNKKENGLATINTTSNSDDTKADEDDDDNVSNNGNTEIIATEDDDD